MKFFSLVFACVFLRIATADASITMSSSSVTAFGNDRIGFLSQQNYSGSTIPTSTALNAVDGLDQNNNHINWSTSGGQTILSLDTNHSRTGTQYSITESYQSLYFTANSSDPYEASGFYNVTDVGNSGEVLLRSRLTDVTVTTSYITLFYSLQDSLANHNEQFVLGGSGGDSITFLTGSLTGTLIAGHNYEFESYAYTQANPDLDSGATAVGNVSLKMGANPTAATPEPGSLLVWGGMAFAAVFAYRRICPSQALRSLHRPKETL